MGYPASYILTSKSEGLGTGVGFRTDEDAVLALSCTGFRDFGRTTVVGFSSKGTHSSNRTNPYRSASSSVWFSSVNWFPFYLNTYLVESSRPKIDIDSSLSYLIVKDFCVPISSGTPLYKTVITTSGFIIIWSGLGDNFCSGLGINFSFRAGITF